MILILTMAGRYRRFTDQGYKTPKYLLPWADRTILWRIVAELRKGDCFTQIYLVANRRDDAFMPHVRAIMCDQGISRENLHLVGDTQGQAETAAFGLYLHEKSGRHGDEPVVFHNVDTILFYRDMRLAAQALTRADGFIDVFQSSNRDYSYVIADAQGRVSEIAEKIVVSDLATSGFYGFANAVTFREHYVPGEDLYVSSVYKRMIAAGKSVLIGEKHKESDTIVLGTPAEYLNASMLVST